MHTVPGIRNRVHSTYKELKSYLKFYANIYVNTPEILFEMTGFPWKYNFPNLILQNLLPEYTKIHWYNGKGRK